MILLKSTLMMISPVLISFVTFVINQLSFDSVDITNYTSNKNIRNITRNRNGQIVKSRPTRWEWQLLISIMHIHDVVTRYNNCAFLCVWHVNITVFFALPPCCVDESYSHVCVPKLYWWMIM